MFFVLIFFIIVYLFTVSREGVNNSIIFPLFHFKVEFRGFMERKDARNGQQRREGSPSRLCCLPGGPWCVQMEWARVSSLCSTVLGDQQYFLCCMTRCSAVIDVVSMLLPFSLLYDA